ncbi:MAG: hypothetical protein QNL03_01275 [Gammaproteobacteria bacterium]|nr:hypothetical protein [Gammaproteobacteria bacterium]
MNEGINADRKRKIAIYHAPLGKRFDKMLTLFVMKWYSDVMKQVL